jgi:SHS2 domain-containing protein
MKYKFLEHTADVKFQAFGKNLNELFENSALALKETICGKIKVKEKISKKIKVKGRDIESLLYKFLEEILYMLEADNFILGEIKNINIKKSELNAVIIGDKTLNYSFTNPVKAITYNEMFIKKQKDRWVSQVVLDV